MSDEHLQGESSDLSGDMCVICGTGFKNEPSVSVMEKGIMTLASFGEKRGQTGLVRYLNYQLSTTPVGKVLVHKTCRRNFTDTKRVSSETSEDRAEMASPKKLRSCISRFDYKEDCLLCGQPALFDPRHPHRTYVRRFSTLHIRDTLLECCSTRADTVARNVHRRLSGCIDLVAAEAVYHDNCLPLFMMNRQMNMMPAEMKQKLGRKNDNEKQHWFERICSWMESEAGAELYTLPELHATMVEFANSSDVYSKKWLKKKLQDHYGEHILFSEAEGRSDVICFRNMAAFIINKRWYDEKKTDIEEESDRIVKTAAKIIRAQLRETEYNTNVYPTCEDISDTERGKNWIPPHLLSLLKILVPSELKQISIGHSIIQSARPKSVISPILFGLGIELDHMFGSRWLITELSRLGFSITYDEVERYKQSVIQTEDSDNLGPFFPGAFTQWVADNVDHNIATLDGQGTFHGMGIIAVCTPNSNSPLEPRRPAIFRQPRHRVDGIIKAKGVPIHQYVGIPGKGLSAITYKPLLQLQSPFTLPLDINSDLLWHSGWLFRDATKPRPNWSGYMQHIFSESESGPSPKSKVLFLPIIDLNPSDETCIYSTLLFVQDQANKLGISSPCLTFDQPLWLKAVEIITAKCLRVVCRLGGFHVMISFLGSIGSMMKGSGLEEAMEMVYGPHAVQHMMSGKAISRALRGHNLVEAALVNKLVGAVVELPHGSQDNTKLTEDITSSSYRSHCDTEQVGSGNLAVQLPPDGDEHPSSPEFSDETVVDRTSSDVSDLPSAKLPKLTVSEAETLKAVYDNVDNKIITFSSASLSPELIKLGTCLSEYKTLLSEKSPTARLWLQYVEYVQILKEFIRSERTGNWNLHLVTMGKMLNLLAATGHIHYAKSCRLYLQMMLDLPMTHPVLYKSFIDHGLHTVRRSNRFWAGLSTDLIIEQVLMRSIKSRGGLTRGRGMTESVRLQWVDTMHRCAEVHDAMTNLTDAKHKTSEQHIELGNCRIERDFQDLSKIQLWFDEHEPFDLGENKLRSLSSGLTAGDGDGVNCDQTEMMGMKIHEHLDEVSVASASIKRSQHVKSLDSLLPGIRMDNQKMQINPTILFSRLIAIAQREDNMAAYFKYELTAVPTSLFRDNFMRKPTKSQLAKSLTDSSEQAQCPTCATYVVDGGALLHRVKWVKNSTYFELAHKYLQYVQSNYTNACIVFDGYELGPSTKDHEHARRVGKTCADIRLHENMEAHNNQEVFLSNEKNKTQFIKLLSRLLQMNGQTVHISNGDADTLIVSCALEIAAQGTDVVVAADDTDLIVLLMYHWTENMADIYLLSDARKSATRGPVMWKIRDVVQKTGTLRSSHILFIHAWSGCDTTSAIYGQGKTSLLKKIESREIQKISSVLSDSSADESRVGEAGVNLFKILYGAKPGGSLNDLRYAKFMEMVSSSKGLSDPQKLPPTERAAYFHSLRVHLQVVVWKSLGRTAMDPKDWGWKIKGTQLVPVMTDLEPAPEALLKFVRCKCKMSSKNPCGGNVCSCRKNGLECVVACGDCRGDGCRNSIDIVMEDSDDTS